MQPPRLIEPPKIEMVVKLAFLMFANLMILLSSNFYTNLPSFPSIWHNEIRNLTANLLTEVRNDVCIEPELLPIDVEVFTGASSYSQDGSCKNGYHC